jgi:hypothetical protein
MHTYKYMNARSYISYIHLDHTCIKLTQKLSVFTGYDLAQTRYYNNMQASKKLASQNQEVKLMTDPEDKYDQEPEEQDSTKVEPDCELVEVDTSTFEYIIKEEDNN